MPWFTEKLKGLKCPNTNTVFGNEHKAVRKMMYLIG